MSATRLPATGRIGFCYRCGLQHRATFCRLCYFNPNGEVVAPVAVVEKNLTYHQQHDLPPLNVWANVRLFNLTENWLLMDTVGNRQLDIADHEAVFPDGTFKPQEVANFLRNATQYILKNGAVIKDGNTMDGPEGSLWRATTFENGLNDPPREVLSWLPANATTLPTAIKDRKRKTSTPTPDVPKPSWWQRWSSKK